MCDLYSLSVRPIKAKMICSIKMYLYKFRKEWYVFLGFYNQITSIISFTECWN